MQIEEYTDGKICRWTNMLMEKYADGRICRWTNMQMDKYADGQICRWKNRKDKKRGKEKSSNFHQTIAVIKQKKNY